MQKVHRVMPGEDFLTLARDYGFTDYKPIYAHPQNAKLVKQRAVNQLEPDDLVVIPDTTKKLESRATDNRHVFTIGGAKVQIRIAVHYFGGEPIANQSYVLIYGPTTVNGATDGDGLVKREIEIAKHAGRQPDTAVLRFPKLYMEWTLHIGELRPVKTIKGLQCRLNNLNFPCGKVDGLMGAKSCAAVREFQAWKDKNASTDGQVDDKLHVKFRVEHEGV